MKIYIGTDHAGFELKEQLKPLLESRGYEVIDKGAFVYDDKDDYPDFISGVAKAVTSEDSGQTYGIIIGGTGQGEAICANKIPGTRAALFYGSVIPKSAVDVSGRTSIDPYEIVRLARLHNNANILALSARFLSLNEAQEAIIAFLDTSFSNDERHIRRINKIEQ